MTELTLINQLNSVCRPYFEIEDGFCTKLSFYEEKDTFGGIIRKYSQEEKNTIIKIVSKFQNLKYLNFRKCQINHFPSFNSNSLEYLDLSSNNLDQFPDWILKHPIKFLNLGANKLEKIPDLDCLPLEILKLHKNIISKFPRVGKKINSLNLYLNRFNFIPKEILDLVLLEGFAFGVTDMKQLPNLASLPNLRWLTLTVNQLNELPSDLCSLKKLEFLQLAKNKIKVLPSAIGEMNLVALTLYSNELKELPDSFFNLKLQKLNLEKNPLISIERLKIVFDKIDFFKI